MLITLARGTDLRNVNVRRLEPEPIELGRIEAAAVDVRRAERRES